MNVKNLAPRIIFFFFFYLISSFSSLSDTWQKDLPKKKITHLVWKILIMDSINEQKKNIVSIFLPFTRSAQGGKLYTHIQQCPEVQFGVLENITRLVWQTLLIIQYTECIIILSFDLQMYFQFKNFRKQILINASPTII